MMPQSAPRVSVVTPTFNRRAWLAECLDSVRLQRGVSWESIVVDDGSTDGTWDWLSQQADETVRAVRLPERGEKSRAANHGLGLARGEHVMFLHDDDHLHPDALAVLAEALDRAPEAVAAVGARRAWFSEEDYARRDAHPRRPVLRNVFLDLLFGWSAVSGQCLYRTSHVRALGGFDPEFVVCEDRDLWLRLARRGPVVLRPETVFTYRYHGGQDRPQDLRALRETVAERAIAALPEADRGYARRVRESTTLVDAAEDRFAQGQLIAGSRQLARAVVATPALFLSPLIGEWTVRRLAGRYARYWIPPRKR